MTSLRQRMIEDMQIRNLSVHTQKCYVLQVSLFARHFSKSPELLGPEQIRAYQIYLTNERKLATKSILLAIAALRFLYKVTLKKNWVFENIIPAPKAPQTLPVVLSPEEVIQFLDCVTNLLCRRPAHLRGRRAYPTHDRQQAHGLARRAGQRAKRSVCDALTETLGGPACLVASGEAKGLALSRRHARPAHHKRRS